MPETALERMQKSNEHGQTAEDREKLGYRTKASTQWVAHYIKISELKEAWSKDPANKDVVFTAVIAEKLLVETWEAKEDTKSKQGI